MPYDKAISPSGMKLYEDCPFLWHERYILGVRGEGNAASERGTQKHDLLEKYFKNEISYPSADNCLGPWRDYMYDLKAQKATAEAEVAVDQFWRPVAFDSPEAWFRGKKDLDVLAPNVKYIYDWKTGKIYPEHVTQGKAYVALDPEDMESYEVRFAYLDIPHHVQEWSYTAEQKQQIRGIIDRKIEVIRMDDVWKPTPGDKCHWCNHSWRRGGKCTKAP